MKCTIPGPNVKVFGRAIHTLCRIGDELFMQRDENDALLLRTVNSTRSAFALIKFHRAFFAELSGTNDVSGSCHNNEASTCKVLLKACLFPFRSLTAFDKTVERCRICVDFAANELSIYMDCRHKIDKSYVVPFIVSENVQAVYSVEDSVYQLQCDARIMHEAVQNFQPGQEEVTLSVGANQVLFNNYVDDDPDPVRSIQTALRFNAEDFDVFVTKPCDQTDVEGSTSVVDGSTTDIDVAGGRMAGVTFCLREFRAVLYLAEALRLAVSFNFSAAGRPIVFCVRNGDNFDAHFVLATLSERPKLGHKASTSVHGSTEATVQNFSDSIDETAFEEIVSPASSRIQSVFKQSGSSVVAQPETSSVGTVNQPSTSFTHCAGETIGNASSIVNVEKDIEMTLPPEFADGEMDISLDVQSTSKNVSTTGNASVSVQNTAVISTSIASSNIPSVTLTASRNAASVTLNASCALASVSRNVTSSITNISRSNRSAAPDKSNNFSSPLANRTGALNSPKNAEKTLNSSKSSLFAAPNSPKAASMVASSSRNELSGTSHPPTHIAQVSDATLLNTPQKSRNVSFAPSLSKCDGSPASRLHLSPSRARSVGSNIFTETPHLSRTSRLLHDSSALSHPILPDHSSSLHGDRPDGASTVSNAANTKTRSSRTVCGPMRFSHFMFARYLTTSPLMSATTAGTAKRQILAANSDSEDDSSCTL